MILSNFTTFPQNHWPLTTGQILSIFHRFFPFSTALRLTTCEIRGANLLIVCLSALIASVVGIQYAVRKILLLEHTFHLTLITLKFSILPHDNML